MLTSYSWLTVQKRKMKSNGKQEWIKNKHCRYSHNMGIHNGCCYLKWWKWVMLMRYDGLWKFPIKSEDNFNCMCFSLHVCIWCICVCIYKIHTYPCIPCTCILDLPLMDFFPLFFEYLETGFLLYFGWEPSLQWLSHLSSPRQGFSV